MKHTSSCLPRPGLLVVGLLLLALCGLPTYAQNTRTVTGSVIDDAGELVIGATVVVPGQTQYATITDMEGKFSLVVPMSTAELEVSFLGYEKSRLKLKSNQSDYRVQLSVSAYELDEVVAIGYGTTKRGNLTGSVSKVSGDDLTATSGTNVASALYGALAGVEISTSSGTLGEEPVIAVRGAASVSADTTPLYVVDGMPVDELGSLNAADIESIEVLKDASSAAIYGSRGANGVILITTKQAPDTQSLEVTFSASYSLQQLERKCEVMSPKEWIAWRTKYNDLMYINARGAYGATVDDDWDTRLALIGKVDYMKMNDPRWSEPDYGGLALIDWQDAFFRTAPMQNYQLTLTSGGKTSKYRVSVGFTHQEGVAIETSLKRLTMRATAEQTIRNRVTVGTVLSLTNRWTSGGAVDGKGNQAQSVLTSCPVAEPEAGLMTGAEPYEEYAWASSGASVVAYMQQVTNEKEIRQMGAQAYIKINIVKGLRLDLTGTYNFTDTYTHRFVPSSVTTSWDKGEGYATSARRQEQRGAKWLGQATLNYNYKRRGHNLTAMAGFSIENSTGTSTRLDASQFPDNSLESFDMDDVSITNAYATITTPIRMISMFGRIQYEYDDRYLITVSLRRDGSNRLGRDNMWGTFPAVSAAYRISNEGFWPEDFVVNSLKLRVSWGITGNNRITTNAALGKLESANYSLGGTLVNGYAPTSIENSMLGWEKNRSWNLGLDIALFRNRIVFSVDAYDKYTEDLLYQVTVPALMGFSKAYSNVGNMHNQGIEFELTTQNLTGAFRWTTSFNAFYNRNEVVSLGDNNSTIYCGYSNTQMYQVGEPIRVYYMYDAVGIYQTEEDLKRYPVMDGSELGDVRYRDANGDGVIDDDDRTICGKPHPDWTFGLKNTFKWKNFDLSIMLNAQIGGSNYCALGRANNRPGVSPANNMLRCWKDMWCSEDDPGDGKTPWIDGNTSSLYDSRWLFSSDYLKLKNVTLGYTFPIKKKSKGFFRKARIYLSADNLLMFDKYEGGYSPEAKNGSSGDYDYGSYPLARVYTLGASVTF